MSTTSLVVQRGDSPWKMAQKSLQQQNKSVDNNSIITEMNRLAQANGCKSVEEFGTKFFSTTGMSVMVAAQTQAGQTQRTQQTQKGQQTHRAQQTVETHQADNTHVARLTQKVDSTQVVRQVHQADSTQVARQAQRTDSTQQARQIQRTDSTQVRGQQRVTGPETIEQEVARINGMENDLTRIIQYNKNHYQGEHYGVVDKKTCQLTIYNKAGQVVKRIPVGVGKTKGDGLSNYYMDHYNKTDKAALAEQNRYTTPGEFTLDEQKVTAKTHTAGYTGTDGKYRVMGMKGDNMGVHGGQQSIHVVYNNDPTRIKGIKSAGAADNRMSYGCVNLLQEDYDAMHELLGEGDKIFILPEEKGNKLQLEKQPDGSYLFHQQNHKADQREKSVAASSKVNYDVRPDRNPALIAKREAAKQQQQQLAQQQSQHQTPTYSWYDPRGWFS